MLQDLRTDGQEGLVWGGSGSLYRGEQVPKGSEDTISYSRAYGYNHTYPIVLDASKSSSIYQTGATVRPPSIGVSMWKRVL